MRHNIWKWWVVGGALATGVYLVLLRLSAQTAVYLAVYLAVGVASAIAVLVGTVLRRPDDRRSWYLLSAAIASFTIGQVAVRGYPLVLHQRAPTPSVGDLLGLVGYPLAVAGLLRLTRGAGRGTSREVNADAAIVAIAALTVWWQYLMAATIHAQSLNSVTRLVDLAAPALDVILVFVVFRALVFRAASRAFHKLLALGLGAVVMANFAVALLHRQGHPNAAESCAALALAGYVLVGAAALHPSMAQPEAPADRRQRANVYVRAEDGRRRTPVVAFAGFLPPTLLLLAVTLQAKTDTAVLAGLCIAVFALIYLRLMWLIGTITGQTNELETHARALEASLQQREALESDLRHLAFHDELTGLANRALLHDRVEQALASAQRTGQLVALCFGDLDGFKTVNDTLGHHVGDSVLVRASRLLTSIVRPGDTVARLGGDEFAVLMLDVGRPDAAVDFAHRLVGVLRDAPDFEGTQIDLSISVGVAYGEPGKTTEQLLTEADSAMYEAKESGKNRVEVFRSSMRSRMLERLDLTSGFRWALGRSEFFLQYQPIVALSDQRLFGFEALVRWNHPNLGEVEPLRFIPMAEETGFIVPLGRWVLVEACEQLATWSSESGERLILSVNLSRRQLVSPHLADEVGTALELSGVDPSQLMLEVTESVLMDDPDRAMHALTELRSLGIRIAVDDFGTGYSSLSHLHRFPVDVLKIDKSFIDPLVHHDSDSAALVTAIIGLARTMGLDVIAEGIEHQSQLHRLVELGCHQGQGFLMARPLDPAAAGGLIAEAAGLLESHPS